MNQKILEFIFTKYQLLKMLRLSNYMHLKTHWEEYKFLKMPGNFY